MNALPSGRPPSEEPPGAPMSTDLPPSSTSTVAVAALHHRRQVAGVGIPQQRAALDRQQPPVHAGGQLGHAEALHQPVQPLQHLGRPVPLPRVRPEHQRSWPIAAAAMRSCPITSPTATPTEPSGSGSTSYQSPPTSARSEPAK